MNQRSTATALLLLLLLLGAWLAPPVAAVPLTVSLSNGITTATCADGAACDASPLAGRRGRAARRPLPSSPPARTRSSRKRRTSAPEPPHPSGPWPSPATAAPTRPAPRP